MKQYWIYILKCSDKSYYTGSTSNLTKRLYEHEHRVYSNFTASRLPVELVYSQEFNDIQDALNAERQIKNWSRKKKEALINYDFDLLRELAKCRNLTRADLRK